MPHVEIFGKNFFCTSLQTTKLGVWQQCDVEPNTLTYSSAVLVINVREFPLDMQCFQSAVVSCLFTRIKFCFSGCLTHYFPKEFCWKEQQDSNTPLASFTSYTRLYQTMQSGSPVSQEYQKILCNPLHLVTMQSGLPVSREYRKNSTPPHIVCPQS